MAWLDLSHMKDVEEEFYVKSGDIPDYFFNLKLPDGFEEWFCLDQVNVRDLRLHLEAQGEKLPEMEGEFLGLGIVPVGWSCAVYLAQTNLRDQVLKGDILTKSNALVEAAPSLIMEKENPIFWSGYVDDLIVAGFGKENVKEAYQDSAKHLVEAGLKPHKEEK